MPRICPTRFSLANSSKTTCSAAPSPPRGPRRYGGVPMSKFGGALLLGAACGHEGGRAAPAATSALSCSNATSSHPGVHRRHGAAYLAGLLANFLRLAAELSLLLLDLGDVPCNGRDQSCDALLREPGKIRAHVLVDVCPSMLQESLRLGQITRHNHSALGRRLRHALLFAALTFRRSRTLQGGVPAAKSARRAARAVRTLGLRWFFRGAWRPKPEGLRNPRSRAARRLVRRGARHCHRCPTFLIKLPKIRTTAHTSDVTNHGGRTRSANANTIMHKRSSSQAHWEHRRARAPLSPTDRSNDQSVADLSQHGTWLRIYIYKHRYIRHPSFSPRTSLLRRPEATRTPHG